METENTAPAPEDREAGESTRREDIGWVLDMLRPEVSTKRSNRRGRETRERLIEAAVACFSEYGYTRTRVADIVHRAGTAQGNFYRHFSSLDEVFVAALYPFLEELAHARDQIALDTTDQLEGLIRANLAYVESYARNRHILRVMREAAAVSDKDGFRTVWLRLRGLFVQRTARWLDRLQAQGAIAETDTQRLAEALVAMNEQLVYVHVGLAEVTPRPEELRALSRTLGEVWYRALPR